MSSVSDQIIDARVNVAGATKLTTIQDMEKFRRALLIDIASLVNLVNNVIKPLFASVNQDAIPLGLSGGTLYVDPEASTNSEFWNSAENRPTFLTEALESLSAEIVSLKNLYTTVSEGNSFDDSALLTSIANIEANLEQITKDAFSDSYTFTNDGEASLANSLQERIAALRTFCGSSGTVDSTPDYSAHGSINIVLDGDSLEESIQKLDEAVTGGVSLSRTLYPADGVFSVDEDAKSFDKLVKATTNGTVGSSNLIALFSADEDTSGLVHTEIQIRASDGSALSFILDAGFTRGGGSVTVDGLTNTSFSTSLNLPDDAVSANLTSSGATVQLEVQNGAVYTGLRVVAFVRVTQVGF